MKANDVHYGCSGYCRRCGATHRLPQGNARFKAVELIRCLEQQKSLPLSAGPGADEPLLSTASLFDEARGKMFGVLEGLCQDGSITWLYAFSGQYNGRWQIPGWAPPLFDVQQFNTLNEPVEQRIKSLGNQLERKTTGSSFQEHLRLQRRELARCLMKNIHALYRLHNFSGERLGLAAAIGTSEGIPTGTGDCCAPKLLNQAALGNIAPLSLAEFYFGRENRSKTRQHGRFYPPCHNKCSPLLGFMLCGAAEQRNRSYAGIP